MDILRRATTKIAQTVSIAALRDKICTLTWCDAWALVTLQVGLANAVPPDEKLEVSIHVHFSSRREIHSPRAVSS